MEIPATMFQALDEVRNTSAIRETKASYLASLVRVQSASNTVACAIISDVAEISEKAMSKLLSEAKG